MAKAEYKEISEIKENGNLLLRVRFKPLPLFWAAFIAGIIMAVVGYIVPLKWIFVAGVATMFYMSFNLFSIPDRWVVSIYDDALIFFSAEPQQRGFRIAASDIVEYNIGIKEKNYLFVRLKNGDEYMAKSFRYDSKVREALKITLPGKETSEIEARRNEK